MGLLSRYAVSPRRGFFDDVSVLPEHPVPSKVPRQTQHRLTEPEVDRLVSAYQDGAGVRELAQEFNIARSTVHAHLDRAGIIRSRGPRRR
jgi:predicted DNA binding protein